MMRSGETSKVAVIFSVLNLVGLVIVDVTISRSYLVFVFVERHAWSLPLSLSQKQEQNKVYYTSLWSKADTVAKFVKRAKGGDYAEVQATLLELYGQGRVGGYLVHASMTIALCERTFPVDVSSAEESSQA